MSMAWIDEPITASFTTLVEAATVGGGVDEISSVMAVEELGELVEASEGIEPGTPGSSTDLPATDAALAGVVKSLKLTVEQVNVPGGEYGGTEPPYFWKVMRPFKWIGLSAIFAVFLVTLARLAPDLIFGQVTDVVNDKSKDTSEADLLALGVFLIGIAGAAASYMFRIRANKFTQSLVAYLRRRAFFRLGALGVDYYDRELPGQVAARCVYDLDRILQFLQSTGFLLLERELGVHRRHVRDRGHRAGRVPPDRGTRRARRDHRPGAAADREPGMELVPARARVSSPRSSRKTSSAGTRSATSVQPTSRPRSSSTRAGSAAARRPTRSASRRWARRCSSSSRP